MKSALFIFTSCISCVLVATVPLKNDATDSPLNTVVVPYGPYSTQLIKDAKGRPRHVYVPLEMSVVPPIALKKGEIAMGSQKKMALHVAEGAYPVYYMPSSANGKFQNKMIYLLE